MNSATGHASAENQPDCTSLRDLFSLYAHFTADAEKSKMHEKFLMQMIKSDNSMIIIGPTGTGKTRTFKEIVKLSPRADKDFAIINCATLNDELVKSELFGHAKGAFTGASVETHGIIESHNHGTVFLDEITEMPMQAQSALLSLIERGYYRKVGNHAEKRLNVRFIAATNRNIATAIKDGHLREDLYHRFANKIPLVPLMERPELIAPLALCIVRKLSEKSLVSEKKTLSKDSLSLLQNYYFSGNVRELEDLIKMAKSFSEGPVIEKEHIEAAIEINKVAMGLETNSLENKTTKQPTHSETIAANSCLNLSSIELAEQFIAAHKNESNLCNIMERELTIAARKSVKNDNEAAKKLGINLNAIRTLIRKHDLRNELG